MCEVGRVPSLVFRNEPALFSFPSWVCVGSSSSDPMSVSDKRSVLGDSFGAVDVLFSVLPDEVIIVLDFVTLPKFNLSSTF